MISFPLTKLNRLLLARAFARCPRVDISIDCVLENQMGKAYTDRVDAPSVFLIEQSGFFCYLAGSAKSAAGEAMVRDLPGDRLLMPSTPGWFEVIAEMQGDRLIKTERYSFDSSKLSMEHLSQLLYESPVRDAVRRFDVELARQASEPFLSMGDFESPQDFVQRGIGFGCYDKDKLGGGAYSSLVTSRSIEVSIFVDDDYRRRGLATALGSALLLWCLEQNVDPHWDAANDESCKLAEKLGYLATASYEAYYLRPR